AYGGIVAFNRTLDQATAERLSEQFVECVTAPAFDAGAEEALRAKKKLRLVTLSSEDLVPPEPWSGRAGGRWALGQRRPAGPPPEWTPVTRRAAGPAELAALRFAWEVAAAAPSNAIALAQGTSLVGLGAGQTSRVDAVDVALMKARRAGHELRGAAL